MKKINLLLTLMLVSLLAACSDDNDIPDVNLYADFEGVTYDGQTGITYAVKGEDFKVTSVNVESLNGEKAALGPVTFYWDGVPFAETIVEPFSVVVPTTALPVGDHTLTIKATVLQEGKSVGVGWVAYKFRIIREAQPDPE